MSDEQTAIGAGGPAELVGLLGEQCALYEQLAVLSDSQRRLIRGGEPEKLLALLGDRQRLLDRVEALAERMRPYQKAWPEMRGRLRPEVAGQVDHLLARMNGLLGSILERDKADAQLLAARKSATGQEMSAVKAGRTAGAAYVATAYGTTSQRDWTDQ